MRWVIFGILLPSIVTVYLNGQNDPRLDTFDPILRREVKRGNLPHIPGYVPLYLQSQYEPSPPENGRFNVVIHHTLEDIKELGVPINSRYRGFATATVNREQLLSLGSTDGVILIEKGGYFFLNLDNSLREMGVQMLHRGENLPYPITGKNVLLGFVDTGIDFFHPDFRSPGDPEKSRILSIWDMSLQPEGNESHPVGFHYGVEYRREHLEADLRLGIQTNVRSRDFSGHGTQVAGIAAGNGARSSGRLTGVAPDAEIIAVKFPPVATVAEIIDGMNYIFSIAEEKGMPAVINLSIGTHAGAHDGTHVLEQAIDQHVEWGNRSVVVAAGNSGDRNIHYGQLVQRGTYAEFEMIVPQYTVQNEHLIITFLWYEGSANAELSIRTPGGSEYRAKTGENSMFHSEEGLIEIIAPLTINPRGARLFAVFVEGDTHVAPAPGRWRIRFTPLTGKEVTKMNSWVVFSSIDDVHLDPSTFRRHTVTIPGTAEGAITVGAYSSRTTWSDSSGSEWLLTSVTRGSIASFSSGGPTRDGRLKPDVTAPGFVVAAPKSKDAPVSMPFTYSIPGYSISAGTSMSAPHVAGLVALLYQANPSLDTEQLREVIVRGAKQDTQTAVVPNTTWGYGKADGYFPVRTAMRYQTTPHQITLFQNYPNPFNTSTTIEFTVPEEINVELAVYDVLGRKVSTLINGVLSPSHYFVNYNAEGLNSGIYLYRLKAGGHTVESKKMIYLK